MRPMMRILLLLGALGMVAAALTPDGRALFVATDRGVWAVATQVARVRATYLPGQLVSSVALSRDGQRIYALQPDREQVAALQAAGGRVLAHLYVGAAARGIERIVATG